MEKSQLAKSIFDVAHLTGEFLLRSGQTSKEYFDKYQFEARPDLLKALSEHLAPLVPSETEVLAGLEVGGIPIATALAMHTGLPLCFVRKEAKKYGTCKFAEGSEVKGKNILIVEDVVTSGGQIILSAADLKQEEAHILGAICVINREQGGPEKLAEKDIELKALFTMTELKTAGGAQ